MICKEYDAVFPSYETFAARLEIPKAYYIFYHYFYKPCVGDSKWGTQISKEGRRLGNDSTEAFAHIMLQNNYMAWLSHLKLDETISADFKTEYDTRVTGDGKVISLMDVVLKGIEIKGGDADTPFGLVEVSKNQSRHEDLKKRRCTQLGRIHVRVKGNWYYKQVRVLVDNQEEVDSDEEEVVSDSEVPLESSTEKENRPGKKRNLEFEFAVDDDDDTKATKRRRLKKELKLYTANNDEGGPKCRGWNDLGIRMMEKMVAEIKEDVGLGKYVQFEAAYRRIRKSVNDQLDKSSSRNRRGLGGKRAEPKRKLLWENLLDAESDSDGEG